MINARNIVLIGMPAAGKTSVGRLLSQRLSRPFVDSDEELERRTGLSIRELFERRGVAGFRALEEEVVEEIVAGRGKVVALGGGAFCSETTRVRVRRTCLTIWLDPPFRVLLERIRSSDRRPIFDRRDPELVLQRLVVERRPSLCEARVRIKSGSIEDAVAEIEKELARSYRVAA